MKIPLPNDCFASEFKVTPKNWDKAGASVKTPWIIHYTFYDPQYLKGLRRQVRGMNNETDLKERQRATTAAIKAELALLKQGFNPFKKAIIPTLNFEVTPYSPFMESLWIAVEKVKASEGHKISLRSVVRGVEKSARQLNIHQMPLKDVTMKYFNKIFEQCYINNPNFTGSTQNRYKKSLHRIYKELFKMEAVESNPLALIEGVRAAKKTRVMPTNEQKMVINKYLKEKHYPFWRAIQLFYHSGSREAEFMRLQAKDVNLKMQEVVYDIRKGVEERQGVARPIKNSVLHLWKELLSEAKPDDYLFSKGLIPGPSPVRREQFARRWKRHVKDKLYINCDLYSLKHLNTTEVMDALDKFHNPVKEVAKMNAHDEAMVIDIYDTGNKKRKDMKIREVRNQF